MMLCTSYDGFYTMELVGADVSPRRLSVKKRKSISINGYFNLFQDRHSEPLFQLGASGSGFVQLCLAHESDLNKVKERFPYMDLYGSVLVRTGGVGSLVEFSSAFGSAFFERCSIVNRKSEIYRCKNILFLAIFRKSIQAKEIDGFFHKIFNERNRDGNIEVHGVFTSDENQDDLIKASQIQNMYLSEGVRETVIGDLLASTPDVIKKAFGASEFIYEPYLSWQDHDGTVNDAAINPDFILRLRDGSTSILDLKLARIDREKLTKGKRNRRRFVDYVSEGISQLANYRFYFQFEKNRQYARQKYGIEISNPTLILVVGSVENIDTAEVTEAMRPYNDIVIVDYDTLVSMFIKS